MGARAARYLNPGTGRRPKIASGAGSECGPNGAAQPCALPPSSRPALGQAGTLACPVPHGAAPTPDGEWARRPPTRARGFGRAVPSAAPRLSLLLRAPRAQPAPLSPSRGCPRPLRPVLFGRPLPARVPLSGSPPRRVSEPGVGGAGEPRKAPRRRHRHSEPPGLGLVLGSRPRVRCVRELSEFGLLGFPSSVLHSLPARGPVVGMGRRAGRNAAVSQVSWMVDQA